MSQTEQSKGKKGRYQRRLKEARIGDAQAQYDVGVMLANGDGVAKNISEARHWLESAAKRGHSDAQFLCGVAFASGAGVERDDWQALRWLFKAHEQGNAKAGPKMARLLEKNATSLARHCWQELARAGLPDAQLALARDCQARGGRQDETMLREALHWFECAAKQGMPQAQHALGVMYADGVGVPQDLARARDYLSAAAQQGMASAAFELTTLPTSADGQGLDAQQGESKVARKSLLANAKRLNAFAIQSSAENQFHLALLYEHGVGVACDKEEARKWYGAAAAQGYAPAQYALAQTLQETDPATAAAHCLSAARQGHVDAQVAYAKCLQHGQGVDADPVEAHLWMTKAAEQGHPEALEALATTLQTGNPAAAWRCWERAARAGSAEGQYRLAELALSGHEVPLDSVAAAQWLSSAAESGHAQAQLRLAGLYAQGLGVERDWGRAALWYERAAENGLTQAQWSLGNLLSVGGPGLPLDIKRAMVLCKLAAKQGYAPAQATMGNLLAQANQHARAVTWWRRAAAQGDSEALYNLGMALLNGNGVDQDQVAGFDALMRAAQQGVAVAQARVGYAYATGEGVALDLLEAAKWWALAAKHGLTDAQANLERARTVLNPAQWAEAERRGHAWQPMVGIA